MSFDKMDDSVMMRFFLQSGQNTLVCMIVLGRTTGMYNSRRIPILFFFLLIFVTLMAVFIIIIHINISSIRSSIVLQIT